MEEIISENINNQTKSIKNDTPVNINELLNISESKIKTNDSSDLKITNSMEVPKSISQFLDNKSTLKKNEDVLCKEIFKYEKDSADVAITHGSVNKLKNMWQEKINFFLEKNNTN